MQFTAGHVVALVGVLGAVVAFDRWSTREDRWREKLAKAVATAKQGDSLQHVRDSLRHIRDSTEQAGLIARADSEEVNHVRLGRENGRLRVQLGLARERHDTAGIVSNQDSVIASQDSIIRSDSLQKHELRQVIAKKDDTILDLNNSLDAARRRLANLIGVAERPPKEFKLLGLTLSLKPYLGVGLNLSPQAKASYGVQLGVSILRG